MSDALLWIPLLPLVGFLINGLLGRHLGRRLSGFVGCAAAGFALLLSLGVFLRFLALPERVFAHHYYTWIESGPFRASFGFLLDPLSMVMVLVVTGVGFLIHVYSLGYMKDDPGRPRFFAYLNLFLCAMLILVLADNYLLMFVGWEGVGLCSYLLIGYYFQKPSAADAGKKAFIVNRIGDFGFVLGLLLTFAAFGTLHFTPLFEQVAGLSVETGYGLLTVITLLLFVGATGKSAQIPLYVWLPDAMEGPTPVSALIHAATMVTAGVYMIVRSNPLYARAPETLFWVAVIGAATALFAATIGVFQRDIKRVLAYSTVSQLGYMFTALGVTAFTAGIFHLFTHAVFKALLFLGAGSVITALHHEQDLQRMGGLRRRLPVTAATMWCGTLAIAGVPFFAGFFSKDEILWGAFSSPVAHNLVFYGLATAAAGVTAFYMVRMMILAFHGQSRLDPEAAAHLHEPPRSMTGVLVVLGALSVGCGWIGLPPWLGPNLFKDFLKPVFRYLPEAGTGGAHAPHDLAAELLVAAGSVLVAGLGIALAWWFYQRRGLTPAAETNLGALHRVVFHKYYVDELYQAAIVRPLARLSERWLWRRVDIGLIDGAVNAQGVVFPFLGRVIAQLQNGFVRSYLAWVVLGFIGLTLFVLSAAG